MSAGRRPPLDEAGVAVAVSSAPRLTGRQKDYCRRRTPTPKARAQATPRSRRDRASTSIFGFSASPNQPLNCADKHTNSRAFPSIIASEPWPSQGGCRDAAPLQLSRFGIPRQARIQQMILPDAIDAQIFPGIALPSKAGVFQKSRRGSVGRNTGGLQTMQSQRREGERDDRAHGRGHVAAAHERQAHPVADTGGLRDAAADVGEGQSADQRAIGVADDQKRVALIGPQVLGIASDATPERASRQIVRRPGRLPRLEKLASYPRAMRPIRRNRSSAACAASRPRR